MAAVLPMDWFFACCSCTRVDACFGHGQCGYYSTTTPGAYVSGDAPGHDPSAPLPCAPSSATRNETLHNLFAPRRKECEVEPLLRVTKKRSSSRTDTIADLPSQAATLEASRARVVGRSLEETEAAEAQADNLKYYLSLQPTEELEVWIPGIALDTLHQTERGAEIPTALAEKFEHCPSPQPPPELETLSADEATSKSALPEVEAEWGTGSVRVLVACAETDTATQLDHWCRRCGIVDMTRLNSVNSEELELTISALCRRCQPGDTCVLLLEASAGVDIVGSKGTLSLEALPLYTTVVSISDGLGGTTLPDVGEVDTSTLEQCQFKVGDSVLLSNDKTFVRAAFACYGYGWVSLMEEMLGGVFPVVEVKRPNSVGLPSPDGCRGGVLFFPPEVLRKSGSTRVVQMLFGVEADAQDGVLPGGRRASCGFCGAMLRAFEALSFADGPCRVSCSEFFAELGDQARDIAEASGLNLQTTLHEWPDAGIADHVCWPIAAKPREMARGGSSPNAPRLSTSVASDLFTVDMAALPSAASQQRERRPQSRKSRQQRRSPVGSSETRTSIRREHLRQQQRAMPNNLGSLSKMLSGGALSDFQRNSATPELLLLAPESDGRCRKSSVDIQSRNV